MEVLILSIKLSDYPAASVCSSQGKVQDSPAASRSRDYHQNALPLPHKNPHGLRVAIGLLCTGAFTLPDLTHSTRRSRIQVSVLAAQLKKEQSIWVTLPSLLLLSSSSTESPYLLIKCYSCADHVIQCGPDADKCPCSTTIKTGRHHSEHLYHTQRCFVVLVKRKLCKIFGERQNQNSCLLTTARGPKSFPHHGRL